MLFRTNPVILLYLIPTILISLTVHEFSHGYVAYRLGDPTARAMGRLSLNPLKHLDFIGTLMLFFTNFGWAKPVPVNPMYFKDFKKGTMVVSLAGPLSNVVLAMISKFVLLMASALSGTGWYAVGLFAYVMYIINKNLAVFNLLPVPPLDGSKILAGILPNRQYYRFLDYQGYVQIALLIIVFMFPGVLGTIMSPFTNMLDRAISVLIDPMAGLFLRNI